MLGLIWDGFLSLIIRTLFTLFLFGGVNALIGVYDAWQVGEWKDDVHAPRIAFFLAGVSILVGAIGTFRRGKAEDNFSLIAVAGIVAGASAGHVPAPGVQGGGRTLRRFPSIESFILGGILILLWIAGASWRGEMWVFRNGAIIGAAQVVWGLALEYFERRSRVRRSQLTDGPRRSTGAQGLPFLKSYGRQTVEELLALEGTYRIDSLVLAFEEALARKAACVGAENLAPEETTVLAIEALEREVNNGGYDQFFTNSSREFAPVVVDALRHIGCPKTAAITERAIGTLGLPLVTAAAIEEVIYNDDDERDEILSECDNQFYEYSEDIEGQLFAFLKANRSKISF